MARQKRSPVPWLITDEELNRYAGISLRVAKTKHRGDVVYVCFRDPLRGGFQTTRVAGTTREEILMVLDETAQIVTECPPDVLRDPLTSFGDVAQAWFDQAAESELARSTLDTKAAFYDAHLAESLGAKPIRDISVGLLRLLMRRLSNEGVGANARSKTQTVLKDVFRWAKKTGFVYVDPTVGLEAITVPKPNNKNDYLSVDEVQRLLDPGVLASLEAAREVRRATYYHVHLRFLVETGCRPGELIAIRDRDLFISENGGRSYVWIHHSRYGQRVKGTKTAAGDRKITISDRLASDLRAHLARRYEHREAADERIASRGGSLPESSNPQGFVFTSPWGRPLNLQQFRKVFGHVCAHAGIDPHGAGDKPIMPHPYTIRRTFLTHLAETNAAQSTMMALAGHCDFRATQVYLGSTEAAQVEAIGNLWSRLGIDTAAGASEADSDA